MTSAMPASRRPFKVESQAVDRGSRDDKLSSSRGVSSVHTVVMPTHGVGVSVVIIILSQGFLPHLGLFSSPIKDAEL